MNVKVFKLINGEEIISKAKENASDWELDSPASIMMQQTEKGVGVGIAPYMPYAAGTVTLYKTGVTSVADPDPKMENEYNRVFGSGIQVVPASALAGL